MLAFVRFLCLALYAFATFAALCRSRYARLKPSPFGMAAGADGGVLAVAGRYDLVTMADGSHLTLLANGPEAMSFLLALEGGHELMLIRQMLNVAAQAQPQQEPAPIASEQEATTAATGPPGGVSPAPTVQAAQARGADSDVEGGASSAGGGSGGGVSPTIWGGRPPPVASRVSKERIERAWSAGCYAGRALQSLRDVPTSPLLTQRPRVWAIVGPSSCVPAGVFMTWGDCRTALQNHVHAQLQGLEHQGQGLVGAFLLHSFPSKEEATAYRAAAGMT